MADPKCRVKRRHLTSYDVTTFKKWYHLVEEAQGYLINVNLFQTKRKTEKKKRKREKERKRERNKKRKNERKKGRKKEREKEREKEKKKERKKERERERERKERKREKEKRESDREKEKRIIPKNESANGTRLPMRYASQNDTDIKLAYSLYPS